MSHIQQLSSDEFEGRAPGTEGGVKTVTYITDQFRSLGLEPGNPDGTYKILEEVEKELRMINDVESCTFSHFY